MYMPSHQAVLSDRCACRGRNVSSSFPASLLLSSSTTLSEHHSFPHVLFTPILDYWFMSESPSFQPMQSDEYLLARTLHQLALQSKDCASRLVCSTPTQTVIPVAEIACSYALPPCG